MELKIPIEIVFDDVNSVIDELSKLQKYKLCEGDDMTLVDINDVDDVLTRHVMAREAKEPCGTKEGWIPCSERLPENVKKHYWVCTDTGYQCECRWTNVNHFWTELTTEWHWHIMDTPQYSSVVAWMPLPKPYGGESDEIYSYI